MTEASEKAPPAVMRLRVALLGIKPGPWRRIEIAAVATLAELHAVIQAAMGWEDVHLHHFRILGRHYDPDYADLSRVRLADLHLRAGERFAYEYNYSAPLGTRAAGRGGRSWSGRPALPALYRGPACLPAGVVPGT